MNDEIKEMLELFGSTDENIMFCDIVELNSKQSHLLLDYITNLQKTNKNHSKKLIELGNKITNLQQENERLKRLVDKDYTELNIAEMKATNYKSKIDKAIELINNTHINCEGVAEDLLVDVLNILQNGSEKDA